MLARTRPIRRRSVLLLGLVLTVLGRANVIGEDDRRPVDGAATGLMTAVGLVACRHSGDNGTRRRPARATGTVVGNRSTVLTAAHVFVADRPTRGPRREYRPETDCAFRLYDADGTLLTETGFSLAAFGRFIHDAGSPNQDWAVLRTETPLPQTTRPLTFAALGFGELDDHGPLPISAVAFHADLRPRWRVPQISEGMLFTIDYAGFPRLAHTADMGRMSSGAAIVHRPAGGPGIVVGIHRSAAQFGDYNLAVPLSIELAATLRSFVWGSTPSAGQLHARATVDARRPAE